MKKIGIVLSGHFRSHKHNFKYLKSNLLDKYDCDLYVSTWNVKDHNNSRKLSEEQLKQELGIYNPWAKKTIVNNTFEFQRNKTPIDRDNVGFWENTPEKKHYIIKEASRQVENNYETDNYWINRISDQWYPVSVGFQSIENPEQYDIIMRHRMDICLLSIDLLFDKDLVVASPEPYSHLYRMRDHIIYGRPEHMMKFSNMYETSLDTIINYNNFLAETVLEYSLDCQEPKSEIYVDQNLKEYHNYRILK